MRIINLSAGGDVFIASLTLKLCHEWYNTIDRIYVNYNNHAEVPQEVVGEFLNRISAMRKVRIIYHPEGIGNGVPIKEGALIAPEGSLIMLLEDDGFIFNGKKVAEAFSLIEDGLADAVGSPRGSCGQEVTDAMIKKYNIDISGIGDKGVNYWPNFFFCKREDLLKTDLNFASKKFGKGEYFKELDHTFLEDNYGDTFVWADIQMRYNGVRFADIPQFHASPEEIDYYEAKQDKWAAGVDIGWIHGGSLSAGWGGYLSGRIPDVSTLQSKMEIETRVAFWTIAVNTTDGYTDFKKAYIDGIENLILKAELSRVRIQKKINIYKSLMQI